MTSGQKSGILIFDTLEQPAVDSEVSGYTVEPNMVLRLFLSGSVFREDKRRSRLFGSNERKGTWLCGNDTGVDSISISWYYSE